MKSEELRNAFLDYFRQNQHEIVASAPMVIKNDPTLMFTNAGMNQFKDIFLGSSNFSNNRVANSQKCLRVSGKHNDLEEVGHDTYHHTMFEMLGNWSFGDYFKEMAIDMAFDFLTIRLGIEKERLYATVFEGSKEEKLEPDEEAAGYWKKHMDQGRILKGSKKDNFWEMGETGPCGPCSEIHIDIRPEEERKKIPGAQLINQDHPLVIEIWNLVFIQYNRKSDGNLDTLPKKHIDTGMGFERLCMVVQDKKSNYDTDIFQPLIQEVAKRVGKDYGSDEEADIAMRVVSDHIRAIAFSIADGQLPSNNKAGYVIRRILRRAVRYGYTFLGQREPFLKELVPALVEVMGRNYPELSKQQELITRVIEEEESSFLRTLDTGLKLLDEVIKKSKKEKRKLVDGKKVFELYDTYGFPLDLTQLILREHELSVDLEGFNKHMARQKDRSRKATSLETDDWNILINDDTEEFIGYDHLKANINISRYRKVRSKGNDYYQLVFNYTPFYAESGGQIGDSGYIVANGEKIEVIDTFKENNQIIHLVKKLPADPTADFEAIVGEVTRLHTANNHSATHLLHHALREVLGTHVEQKGSLVHPEYLRFDFSHFKKVEEDELEKIEAFVNEGIRANLPLEETREVPMAEAKKMGAISLFGEKYGDLVRVVKFGESVELCGGTHVAATGQIGLFKIISESAIAAGIRRIEAITGVKAQTYVNERLKTLKGIQNILKNSRDLMGGVKKLLEENTGLSKKLEDFRRDALKLVKHNLVANALEINGTNVITEKIEMDDPGLLRDLSFQIKNEVDNLFLVLGAEIGGKAFLSVMISENLIEERGLNASDIISDISSEIKGGGGGQPFFATAGGKDPSGLNRALSRAREIISRNPADQ